MNKINLLDAKKNQIYKIKSIELKEKDILKLLGNLGFNIGSDIKIIRSNLFNKSYMVSVSGINFGLDKKICEGIFVE